MKPASRLLLILAVLMAVSVRAQTARPAPGRIQGRVVQRDTDAGAAGIAVVLTPSGTTSLARQVITREDGRFVFDNVDRLRMVGNNLEPARYTLTASPVQSGSVSIAPATVTVTLPAQEEIPDITLVATPTGTLSGRLLDPDGKPKEGQVFAVRPEYRRGRRVLDIVSAWRIGSANKDGLFEIKGLEVDKEYLLAAWPRAEDLTQFFPGVVDPADAIPVTIPRTGGNPLPDFRLVRPGAYSVNLKVPEPARAQTSPPPRLGLSIGRYSRNGILVVQGYRQTAKLDGDRYTLSGFFPGLYEIHSAWTGVRDGNLAVAVTDTDLDVDMTFAPPAQPGESRLTIKAEVKADAKPSPLESTLLAGDLKYPRLKLWPAPNSLQALLGWAEGGSGFFSFYRDGNVSIDLAGGSYTVDTTSLLLSTSLLPDAYVSAARYAGNDVLNSPLVFDAAASGRLDVTFDPRGVRIEGVVHDSRNNPAWNATVVLFPQDRANTFGALKTAITDQDGRFEIRGVRPGLYGLLAWEGLEKGAYENQEFLAEYAQRQVHVQAETGQDQSFNLQALPKADTGVLTAAPIPLMATVGRPAEKRPDGKARTRSPDSADVTAIVTDVTTGKPVPDVVVRIDGKEVKSGADGRFKIEDVGTSSLPLGINIRPVPGRVVRDAFAGPRELQFSRSDWQDAVAYVTFKSGERIDLVIHMESVAVVRGRILDPKGQPASGLEVVPTRVVYGTDGIPGPVEGKVTWTNEKGEFVLRLDPGRYAFRLRFKLDVESGKAETYATSYYPSVSDPATADWIALAAGSETNLDPWILRSVPSTPVRLRLFLFSPENGFDRGSRYGCTPSTSIVARNRADSNDAREGRRPGPLSRFAASSEECVPELPPGAYDLLVSTEESAAQVSIDVKPGDTQSVDVVLEKIAPVAGRVMLVPEDPSTPAPRPVSRVRVELRRFGSLQRWQQTGTDGSFRLGRSDLGEYRLSLESLPRGTYLKSMTRGGRRAVGDDLSITSTETGDVEIHLGEAEETVVGRVVSSDGDAIPGALVVLVPLDRAALPTITGNASRSGSFEIYVPAGRYRVFAWSSVTDGAYYNPEFMAPRMSTGRLVDVPRHGRIDLKGLVLLDER